MSEALILLGYAAVVVALVILEAWGRRRPDGPTASWVFGALLGYPAVQLVAAVAWLWLGWHLFVRASH